MPNIPLRRGDLVEVLMPSAIIASLDAAGTVDELPFMPEMAAYCGRRFTVERRAEKVCDTIKYTGSRRLRDAVLLGDLRCDGATHGGCQAECRLFFKEVWLRRVGPESPPPAPAPQADLEALTALTARFVRQPGSVVGSPGELWSCQATQLMRATSRLGTFDPRAYVREYACGNVSLPTFLSVTARAAVEEPLRKLGLVPEVHLPGPGTESASAEEPLHLQPGEYVKVKSREEIARTLNSKGYNRGLWFDREMMAYCGGTFQVRRRIQRFIDDRFSRMVDLKSDCVTLEGVVCTGELSSRRWFCPRAAYPYWRECWLQRI